MESRADKWPRSERTARGRSIRKAITGALLAVVTWCQWAIDRRIEEDGPPREDLSSVRGDAEQLVQRLVALSLDSESFEELQALICKLVHAASDSLWPRKR